MIEDPESSNMKGDIRGTHSVRINDEYRIRYKMSSY